MGVSFASFEIARSGLAVNERGLSVTGQNISNVNTPGYVRQQAMITTGPYQNVMNKNGMFQLGLGADIQQIRQIRHAFLDNIYRKESTTLGYWEAKSKTFQDVQAVLGEPMGAGLQNIMNQFWDSWQELSKEPDSLTVRALVRQRGEAVVQQVNHLGAQLDKLQSDLNSEIRVRIDEINEITTKIASLNVEILKNEISTDSANDYRDQRNTLVDRLCKLADVQVNEMQDGQLDITLGGYFLVTKGIQRGLYAEESQAGSGFVVPKLQGTDIIVTVNSGTLKGLMEARGEVFGARGSVENGSPYDKVDLVFAINRDATTTQKDEIKDNIQAIVDSYKAKGIDVRLGIVEYAADGTPTPVFASDVADFKARVDGLVAYTGDDAAYEGLQSAEGMDFRANAVKQFVLVTGSAMDEDPAAVASLAAELKSKGISTSVISDAGTLGSSSTPGTLANLVSITGGKAYDTDNPAVTIETALEGVNSEIHDDIYNNIFHTSNVISDLKNQLNLMINVMVREVNSIHASGITLTGATGINFFEAINSDYPMEMGNLKLSSSLAGSDGLNNIAASQTGQNGDNTIALAIANMRHTALIGKEGETLSLDDFYRAIILEVGNNASDAERIADSQNKLVQSADNQRQAIAGVSMDEEMNNMMKYKFAYNASSRVINVLDEMLETVIARTGLAGR